MLCDCRSIVSHGIVSSILPIQSGFSHMGKHHVGPRSLNGPDPLALPPNRDGP